MVVKCVSFLDEDQINIIPETCSKPTVNKGRTISRKTDKNFFGNCNLEQVPI